MPTYSYACTECSNRFDVVQAFSDDALTNCDQCNGRLRKIFGKVGVVFKGSGFYRTDSREAGKASSNGSGNGSSPAKTAAASDSGNGSTDGGTKSADKTSGDGGTKSVDKPKADTTAAAGATSG